MAKIEDLVRRIEDESLREAISAEVKELKKTKRFGLVFEEHLPETVRLPNVPVRKGCLVAKKAETGNACWQVLSLSKGQAKCKPVGSKGYAQDKVTIPVEELVVVKPFGEPIFPTLTPIDRVARGGPDKPWHTLINADNFHALQLLLYCYEGQVDVIYIDPPYNSGARDWKYNNRYVEGSDSYRHSKWLSMIRKRLTLAKRLLRPNSGVIIVTIDDYENHSLAHILDELFPDYQRNPVVVRYNRTGSPRNGLFRVHEYAHFLSQADFERDTSNSYTTTRNLRKNGNASSRSDRKSMFYPIFIDPNKNKILGVGAQPEDDFHPSSAQEFDGEKVLVWPIDDEGIERRWSWSSKSVVSRVDELFVTSKSGIFSIRFETLNNPVGDNQTIFDGLLMDAATHGSNVINETVGKNFPYPKSLYAVAKCINMALRNQKNGLILDFFAGSGTTFHATSLLNARDGGARRSIMVTNNEVSYETATRLKGLGYSPGDPEYEIEGIADSITWPRSKAVTEGKTADGKDLSIVYHGFGETEQEEAIKFAQIKIDVETASSKKSVLSTLKNISKLGCDITTSEVKDSPFSVLQNRETAILWQMEESAAFVDALSNVEDLRQVIAIGGTNSDFRKLKTEVSSRVAPPVKVVEAY